MSVNVTTAFNLESFDKELFERDDFLGDQIQDEWRNTGDSGGSVAVVDAQTGGIARITTDGDDDDEWYLDWGNIRTLLPEKELAFEVRAAISTVTTVQVVIGLFDDANDLIRFVLDTDTDGNWYVDTTAGGTPTSTSTGTAADTSIHTYRITCHFFGVPHVHFYIDGAETTGSPSSTNITAVPLQPYLFVHNRSGNSRTMDVDYVAWRQNI